MLRDEVWNICFAFDACGSLLLPSPQAREFLKSLQRSIYALSRIYFSHIIEFVLFDGSKADQPE